GRCPRSRPAGARPSTRTRGTPRAPQYPPPTVTSASIPGSVRGSVTRPLLADAAAVSGEARNVRPPLPWRPSKLRLDVLIAYWPGDRWSPFLALHLEHPSS